MKPKRENYEKCLALFASGTNLREIAKIENMPEGTLMTWHHKYNWKKERIKHKEQTNKKMHDKLSNEKAKQAVSEIQIIDHTIAHLVQKLPNANAQSAEGIGRAISDLLKTKGLHTGLTIEQHQHAGTLQVIPLLGGEQSIK
jgi:transposase